MALEDERKSRGSTRIPQGAKVLMILVAVVTVLAIWLLPSDKQAPPTLPELEAPPEADRGIPSPLPAMEADDGTAILRAGDRAREIIATMRAENSEPNPDEVFGHAELMQREHQLDDAYLLYRFAARKGHAQAALVLGSQADPAYYSAETSILAMPDLEQAYKWYSVAAAAGNAEAEARLQGLRARVEQSAADGDGAAKRLMLQWR